MPWDWLENSRGGAPVGATRPSRAEHRDTDSPPRFSLASQARRAGHPRILHIRRKEAKANRRASSRGIPKNEGFDRDEYPPAMSDEGGKGASVRYIKSDMRVGLSGYLENRPRPK